MVLPANQYSTVNREATQSNPQITTKIMFKLFFEQAVLEAVHNYIYKKTPL